MTKKSKGYGVHSLIELQMHHNVKIYRVIFGRTNTKFNQEITRTH